ncbi:MAG: hypothetical protein ACRDHS_08565 [Actinomycetota bacterium]
MKLANVADALTSGCGRWGRSGGAGDCIRWLTGSRVGAYDRNSDSRIGGRDHAAFPGCVRLDRCCRRGAFPIAALGKSIGGCPPGFDLGGLALEQALQLPNVQAGLAAGFYDEEFVAEVQDTVDANDDGVICFQTIPASGATSNPASNWQYFYNVVDNKASVPIG